jgi:VID27 PH-like domain
MEKRGDVKALKPASTKAPPPFRRPSTRQEAVTLTSVSAGLHLFDATEGVFMLQDAHVTASVVETGPWECESPSSTFVSLTILDWLQVTSGQKVWISQQMDPEMNPVFNYVLAFPSQQI